MLCSLLFLIDIDILSGRLKSICKIYADDMSLFSKVKDLDTSNTDISNNLVILSRWAYQWKMFFNLDINKQVTEVNFYQRCEKKLWKNSNNKQMYYNNRTNKKTFLNIFKETIAYNLQNICKTPNGLCTNNLIRLFKTFKNFINLQYLSLLEQ